jgi:hypothetical protein
LQMGGIRVNRPRRVNRGSDVMNEPVHHSAYVQAGN